MLLLSLSVLLAGPEKVINDFSKFHFSVVIAILIVFAFNLILVSFRLSKILNHFGINLPFSVATKASLQGHFASLFFISLFGQVAGRHNVLRLYGAEPVLIAALTALERIILFAVSAGLAFTGAIWILDVNAITAFLNDISIIQVLFVSSISFLASFWFGKSKFESRLFNSLFKRHRFFQLTEITLITLLAQSLVIGTFVLAGLSLAPEIGFWKLFAAAALTSFAASLPISVNGWGIREITAIFAFGTVGMPSSMALAISVLIGLSSTAVVLATYPYIFTKSETNNRRIASPSSLSSSKPNLEIEKSATYLLIIAGVILIFFQIHVSLPNGLLNINLADPFAILALAAVVTHAFFKRQLPLWSIQYFNLSLFIFTCLLVFSFVNGLHTIGITQWALTGRTLGWLVLLGYLSFGILAASYFRRIVLKRFIETLIATSVAIILFHAIMRWLIYTGWLDAGGTTLNFEGFSGNRNAFAFQLLSCSALLLAFTNHQKKLIPIQVGKFKIQREQITIAAHGIILAGIVFTGSRAGILTGLFLLIFSGASKFTNLSALRNSLLYGFIVWAFFILFLPWFSQIPEQNINTRFAVQSIFSHDDSNLERWESIRYGFEMWKDSPWLGAGLGVFTEISPQWFKEKTVIHSTPVWVLAELGLIGAVILIAILTWFLVSIVRTGIRKPTDRAAIMLLGVFIVFSLVHEIFYQRIFWLVLGFCLAVSHQERLKERFTRS